VKVALVNPPYFAVYKGFEKAARIGACYPPMGLLYLAGKLLEDGHEVRIYDVDVEDIKPEGLGQKIRDFGAQLVGLTSTTPTILEARAIAQAIKATYDVPIIIGGAHVTVVGEHLLQQHNVFDFAAMGEAEITLSEFVRALENGTDLADVDGILYRDGDTIVRTLPRALVANLDDLPFPARQLIRNDLYLWAPPGKEATAMAGFLTKRGCPYKCSFCSQDQVFTRDVRYRSVENVLLEMEWVNKSLGIHHIHIFDDTLVLDRARAIEIAQGILDRGLNFTWEGMARANLVDPELLDIQSRAGLTRMSFGIETGNAEILKNIYKNVTLDDIREGYRMAKEAGIETRGSAIIGHPNETRKTAWDTIKFLRSLKHLDQVYLNIMVPYPGTAVWHLAKSGQSGYRLLSEDFEQYVRYETPVLEVNDLNTADLAKLQKIGLWFFYLTPRRIYHNLFRSGLKTGLKMAWAFTISMIGSWATPRLGTTEIVDNTSRISIRKMSLLEKLTNWAS